MTEANFVRIESQIPKNWKEILDRRALESGCTTTSEAIRNLIRDFIEA